MTDVTIVTSWDSLPPEVYAFGEVFSTRVLHKQALDLKTEVAALKAENKRLRTHIENAEI